MRRRSGIAASASASASQIAMPPPRSAAQVNQPDFGVMTPSGAASGSPPGSVATTLLAREVRRSPSISSTPSPPTSMTEFSARTTLDGTCSTGMSSGLSMRSALRTVSAPSGSLEGRITPTAPWSRSSCRRA